MIPLAAHTGVIALQHFQQGFADALFDPDAAPGDAVLAALVAQPAFAVYRNTVMTACIDALQANHPAVCRLVGDDWFRAAAAVFVRARPPRSATLGDYGAAFADFLAGFEPARELPYLADVARLDRAWGEAHAAADAPPMRADVLAGLGAAALGALRLAPHPAARWHAAPLPAFTIWSRNRVDGGMADGPEIDWKPEATLITRPREAVQWCALPPGGGAFLDACAQGATLADAAQAALALSPDGELASLLALLLERGALCAPTAPSTTESP